MQPHPHFRCEMMPLALPSPPLFPLPSMYFGLEGRASFSLQDLSRRTGSYATEVIPPEHPHPLQGDEREQDGEVPALNSPGNASRFFWGSMSSTPCAV